MIRSSVSAFVHGVGVSVGWRDPSVSLTDLIFRAVTRAVADSGVDMAQIESVVLSAHDLVDGRSLSSMVTAPAAGAYLRDEIRLVDDGLAAVSLAAARIESGETEFSIVAAWGRASEGNYADTSRFGFDPFSEQPFGMDEFAVSSLRLSAWIGRYGARAEARQRACEASARRAGANPRAVGGVNRPLVNWPLFSGEAPNLADVVVATVIGRPEALVRIAGIGHSTDASNLGERNLLKMPALCEAVDRAGASGRGMVEQVDVYQIAGSTLTDEALALEALQLAEAGRGFEACVAMTAVNPSGGRESGWCSPTGGLLNFAEVYLQLTGQAGGVQLPGRLRRGLATGVSPKGGQIAHAVMLEAA